MKPIIYQLVVRYFGNTNTTNAPDATIDVNGCGRFADINEAALQSLRALGVTHIWLTGVLRHSTLSDYSSIGLPADDPDIVKGRAGSFYSVRDYFDVDPDLALQPENRLAEFDALLARIHAAGMQALIDFVPNHVARSYASVVRPDLDFGAEDDQSVFFHPQNHFFYLVDPPDQKLMLSHPPDWQPEEVAFDGAFALEDGSPGHTPKATGDASRSTTTSAPHHTSWYEAIKLNYGWNYVDGISAYGTTPRTWYTMDSIIAYWQERGVDGFRCDMAHLIPAEAWTYLIERAKDRGSEERCFFMAEAYVNSSGLDPITDVQQLLDAGFDAIYHDNSYDRLIELYRGGPQDAYDNEMRMLSERERAAAVEYLENHDESRAAAPIEQGGFGSPGVNYQLAPLQYLYSSGPVLLLNGQEVGEPGAGKEGFHDREGRTTFFDYWCMPEFAGWVNGHKYDGAGLRPEQKQLRAYFHDLLHLCQHAAVRSNGYWGLKYFNRQEELYSFARYAGNGEMLIVAANFAVSRDFDARIRIPVELVLAASLPETITVKCVLTKRGACEDVVAAMTRDELSESGFQVTLDEQEARVYMIIPH